MNIKSFFVAALGSAIDLGMASHDDVLKHFTPEILSAHLPRPLWARLLTACLGAPKVDAQIVVETIGIANLCEHIPSDIIWNCLEEIGVRAIGGTYVPKPVASTSMSSLMATPAVQLDSGPTRVPLAMAPPPEQIAPPPPVTATQPSPTVPVPEIPSPGLSELFGDVPIEDRPTGPAASATRSRTPTQQRFRQGSTGIGRLAGSSRRPQAAASAPPPYENARRASTESEYEVITDVGGKSSTDDWKNNLAVEDEQLVDWAGSEETVSGDPGTVDERRKR